MNGTSPLRVGIIGLSAHGGWAAMAHLPALRANPGFEIRAVSGSSPAAAALASSVYGIPVACASANEMAARNDLDLIVVAVKVPHHRDLVETALRGGKMVYCEWPLAVDLEEAKTLVAAQARAGVPGFVGLQGRAAPAIRYLRDIVRDGAIGEVLSTSLIGSGGAWGTTVPPGARYTLDRSNGATMTSIPLGHTLDAMGWTLGEFTELTAIETIRRPQALDLATGEMVERTAGDQVAIHGVLENGAIASAHYRGGVSLGTNLFWEINGTEGDIRITGDSGHLQYGRLRIEIARRGDAAMTFVSPSERYFMTPPPHDSPAFCVGEAYARLLQDLRGDNASQTPTFADALQRHRMLDAIERSVISTGREAIA